MAFVPCPGFEHISLEVGGVTVASASGYAVKAVRENRTVESFGEDFPVGRLQGAAGYTLELRRIAVLEETADFYASGSFDVVITRPGQKITYSGCRWVEVGETAAAAGLIFESMRAVADTRTVTVSP